MGKKRLTNSRQVDINSTNQTRYLIEFDNTVVWRDVRIDDYGIDALLEFFPDGEISGRYMPMQLKGTSKTITPLMRPAGFVSCKINQTTLEYGKQDVLPILILYVSLQDRTIYYGILQRIFKRQTHLLSWDGASEKVTVHLPISNMTTFDDKHFGGKLWGLYQSCLDG